MLFADLNCKENKSQYEQAVFLRFINFILEVRHDRLVELVKNAEDPKGLFCHKNPLIHSPYSSYYQERKRHIIVQ
jgi:hypothetical protein